MRVEFVTRESTEICVEIMPGWHTIVCCSASRRERSDGDSYVQGAGDDTEHWSRGLTPDMFWKHRNELLGNRTEEELQQRVDEIVEKHDQGHAGGSIFAVQPKGAAVPFYVGKEEAVMADDTLNRFDVVVCCGLLDACSNLNKEQRDAPPSTLQLKCPSGKLGSRMLRDKLPSMRSFLAEVLLKKSSPKILFACSSGKDLSIGAALAYFCMYVDDQGMPIDGQGPRSAI